MAGSDFPSDKHVRSIHLLMIRKNVEVSPILAAVSKLFQKVLYNIITEAHGLLQISMKFQYKT